MRTALARCITQLRRIYRYDSSVNLSVQLISTSHFYSLSAQCTSATYQRNLSVKFLRKCNNTFCHNNLCTSPNPIIPGPKPNPLVTNSRIPTNPIPHHLMLRSTDLPPSPSQVQMVPCPTPSSPTPLAALGCSHILPSHSLAK